MYGTHPYGTVPYGTVPVAAAASVVKILTVGGKLTQGGALLKGPTR